jgi:hypothetical protein
VAERVRLSDSSGDIATVDSIRLEGSYTGLLQSPKLVSSVRASGLRLVIPSLRAMPKMPGSGSGLIVKELRVDNATLNFKPDTEFLIHSLVLNNVGKHERVGLRASLRNPAPLGEVRAQGQFGPIVQEDPGRTPVSGAFTFQHADLSIPHGIEAATLNASGTFRGPLQRIECMGTGDLPVFQVFSSSHSVRIASAFNVSVDARSGDVVINHVLAHFNGTTVSASGNVVRTHHDRHGGAVRAGGGSAAAVHEAPDTCDAGPDHASGEVHDSARASGLSDAD